MFYVCSAESSMPSALLTRSSVEPLRCPHSAVSRGNAVRQKVKGPLSANPLCPRNCLTQRPYTLPLNPQVPQGSGLIHPTMDKGNEVQKCTLLAPPWGSLFRLLVGFELTVPVPKTGKQRLSPRLWCFRYTNACPLQGYLKSLLMSTPHKCSLALNCWSPCFLQATHPGAAYGHLCQPPTST